MNRTGAMVTTILAVLEELDSYVFEKLDTPSNTMEALCTWIFNGLLRPGTSVYIFIYYRKFSTKLLKKLIPPSAPTKSTT